MALEGNSPLTWRYRPHVRWGWLLISALFGIVAVPVVADAVAGSGRIAVTFLPFSLVLGLVCLPAYVLWRRHGDARVTISGDVLLYESRRRSARISLREVEAVSFRNLAHGFVWVTIRGANATVRVTAVLEHFPDFVHTLLERLDAVGNGTTYDEDRAARYLVIAQWIGQGWDRIYAGYPILALAVTAGAAASGACAIARDLTGARGIAAVVAGVATPLLVVLTGELVLLGRLKARAQRTDPVIHERNRREERRVFAAAAAVWALAAVALIFWLSAT